MLLGNYQVSDADPITQNIVVLRVRQKPHPFWSCFEVNVDVQIHQLIAVLQNHVCAGYVPIWHICSVRAYPAYTVLSYVYLTTDHTPSSMWPRNLPM